MPYIKATEELFEQQLTTWEQAGNNYKALEGVIAKEVLVDGFPFKVQFNPARIVSSAAKVDTKSIQERKCFLCAANRPAVQKGVDYVYLEEKENPYSILVNPFPIFPRHLTIPLLAHTDQKIYGKIGTMLDLALKLPDYTLFYNGPKCGASAPDHFHFQAGNRGFLPLETHKESLAMELLFSSSTTSLSMATKALNGLFIIESSDLAETQLLFNFIYSLLEVKEGESEPMMNILCWYCAGKWNVAIFVRSKHRPTHYFAEGDANILISPASVDLGGVFITPLEKDFNKITSTEIKEILAEICISFEETANLAKQITNKLQK
jgi:hypothetical protein